jgi:tripartite-type tricarboxylate transporter receptor subunit TctC
LQAWESGLDTVWAAANKVAAPKKSPHDSIKLLIDALEKAVAIEQARVPLSEEL